MRRGITLIEVLVSLAILSILAAIVFAVAGAVKSRAMQASCLSNMKQLAAALQIYVDVNDGGVAHSNFEQSWKDTISANDLRCPLLDPLSDEAPTSTQDLGGYAQNDCLSSMLPAAEPTKLVAFTEAARFRTSDSRTVAPYQPHHLTGPDIFEMGPTQEHVRAEGYVPDGDFGATRHAGGSCYAFVDGHVGWLRPEELRLPQHGYGCVHLLKTSSNWRGPEGGPFFAYEEKHN